METANVTEELVRCPLCAGEVPRVELGRHQREDDFAIRATIIALIRNTHPEWVEDDGSCFKCWEYFRRL